MVRLIVRSFLILILLICVSPRPASAFLMIRDFDLILPVPDIGERFTWLQSVSKPREVSLLPELPPVRFSHVIEDVTLWTLQTEDRLWLAHRAPTVPVPPFTVDPAILRQPLNAWWSIGFNPPSEFLAIVRF